ncbi:IS3 family transposase [Anaeromicrobium sediminis]|uniref:Integrase catalytic domain-containing protein n=1 Tax=Anaeromicrobium sediminis TaxID=1478221 RepID=A0A267M8E3_9FIRM|nr:hypothetical protein CCE28_21570 [Anaeromicrobium sediminis]
MIANPYYNNLHPYSLHISYELKQNITNYINFYNLHPSQSKLKGMTPIKFRNHAKLIFLSYFTLLLLLSIQITLRTN